MSFASTPPDFSPVETLQNLCGTQICRTFTLHARAMQFPWDNNDKKTWKGYVVFQKWYMNGMEGALCSRNALFSEFVKLQRRLRSDANLYTAWLNFVFNPYVKKIDTYARNYLDFDEEVISAIIRNCKDLRNLLFSQMSVPLKLLVYLRNLVVLDLAQSSFNTVRTMKAIANCLHHLRMLYLQQTEVDDRGILTLCGHEYFESNPVSQCLLLETCVPDYLKSGDTKACKIFIKTRLQEIDLSDTKVTSTGLICLLTHIQTLKCVRARTTQSIEIYRTAVLWIRMQMDALEKQNFPFRSLHMDTIEHYIESFTELESFLLVFPRMKSLVLRLTDNEFENNSIARALEQFALRCLECVEIYCQNTNYIFTDSFKRFWTRKGSQLSVLRVAPLNDGGWLQSDLDFLSYILSTFRELRRLKLKLRFGVHISVNVREYLEQFSGFPNLEILDLGLYNEDVDLVNSLAAGIIRLAPKLKHLTLKIEVNCEILLPCMSPSILPLLKKVSFTKSLNPNINKDKVRHALLFYTRCVIIEFQ